VIASRADVEAQAQRDEADRRVVERGADPSKCRFFQTTSKVRDGSGVASPRNRASRAWLIPGKVIRALLKPDGAPRVRPSLRA
jgi:hypothetical protein